MKPILLALLLTGCSKWTLGPFPDEPRQPIEAPLPWGPPDGAHKAAHDGGEAGAKPDSDQ